jgi:uncharacterized protein YciI
MGRRSSITTLQAVSAEERSGVKYVLFYESGEDVASNAPPVFTAHKARLDEFHDRGSLLMVGTLEDAQQNGLMAIFTTREDAEEFARDDPFVVHGVVARWRVLEWNEILAGP